MSKHWATIFFQCDQGKQNSGIPNFLNPPGKAEWFELSEALKSQGENIVCDWSIGKSGFKWTWFKWSGI